MVPSKLRVWASLIGLLLALVTPLHAGDLYEFSLSDEEGFPGGLAEVTLSLDSEEGEALAGYSAAVCSESTLLSMDKDGADVTNGSTVVALDFLFHAVTVHAEKDDETVLVAFTIGAALSVGTELEPAADEEMYLINFSISRDAEIGEVLVLEWCVVGDDTPVSSSVVRDDLIFIREEGELSLVDGSITVVAPPPSFIRGDANHDGSVDILDAVQQLRELFGDGSGRDCDAANDSNDDSAYDSLDPLYTLYYRFLEGLAPAAPYPDCDYLGDQQRDDCELQEACE